MEPQAVYRVQRGLGRRSAPRESVRTVALAALHLLEEQLQAQAEAGVDVDAETLRVTLRLRAALELPTC